MDKYPKHTGKIELEQQAHGNATRLATVNRPHGNKPFNLTFHYINSTTQVIVLAFMESLIHLSL
jgi:hypothetical protein